MIHNSIVLKEHYNLLTKATLEVQINENFDFDIANSPALIIVPGGGYEFLSKREGDPVANKFLTLGYNCFILKYSILNKATPLYPNPQYELCCAYDYIYNHYKEFKIDRNKIFIVGFSAGGHLVGSFCCYHKEYCKELSLPFVGNPKAICLAYPVITLINDTHEGTKKAITNNYNELLINKLSIENNIDKEFPSTFIWTTKDDTCVPPISTTLMVDSMNKKGIKNKCIVYEKGNHGLSVCTPLICFNYNDVDPNIYNWVNECDSFFNS